MRHEPRERDLFVKRPRRSTLRVGLVLLAVTFCIGLHQGWFARAYDRATTAALSEDARVAVDVGCQGRKGRAADECRSRLKRLYLSGALDPGRTLQAYCDSIKTARWGASRPPAPKVCVEYFGGWRES